MKQLIILIIQLRQQSNTALGPVLFRHERAKLDRQNEVCGVAGCRKNTMTLAGLVDWACDVVDLLRRVEDLGLVGRADSRPQPNHGHAAVELARQRLRKYSAASGRVPSCA